MKRPVVTRVVVKFVRVMLVKAALRRRQREVYTRGGCIWHGYLLCCGSFKPGWKEKLEREMKSLEGRALRIERRLSLPWWRWP